MTIPWNKLVTVVAAVAVFAWFYDTFFDDTFIEFGDERVVKTKSPTPRPEPSAASEAAAPEAAEPPAPKPAELPRGEPAKAAGQKPKVNQEIKRREASDREMKIKREKWAQFYKPSPMCKSMNANWDVVVRCANELLRANEEFEKLYREGKI